MTTLLCFFKMQFANEKIILFKRPDLTSHLHHSCHSLQLSTIFVATKETSFPSLDSVSHLLGFSASANFKHIQNRCPSHHIKFSSRKLQLLSQLFCILALIPLLSVCEAVCMQRCCGVSTSTKA